MAYEDDVQEVSDMLEGLQDDAVQEVVLPVPNDSPDDGLDPTIPTTEKPQLSAVNTLVGRFDTISTELMAHYKEDRTEIETIIQDIRAKIQSGVLKEYYFTALASLLATKTLSTASAIKQMDSIAKIIAATKNHEGLGGGGSLQIGDLLDD